MTRPKWEMVYRLLDPDTGPPDFDGAILWAKKYFRKPLRPQTSFGLAVIREISHIRDIWEKVNRRKSLEALSTLRRFIKREGYIRAVSRVQTKYRKSHSRRTPETIIAEALAAAFRRAVARS